MLFHLPKESRSIFLTGQRPGDPILLLLEGLGTHGLACQRGLYFRKHIIIARNPIRSVGWRILHLDVVWGQELGKVCGSQYGKWKLTFWNINPCFHVRPIKPSLCGFPRQILPFGQLGSGRAPVTLNVQPEGLDGLGVPDGPVSGEAPPDLDILTVLSLHGQLV